MVVINSCYVENSCVDWCKFLDFDVIRGLKECWLVVIDVINKYCYVSVGVIKWRCDVVGCDK